jgi:hypothetical protein
MPPKRSPNATPKPAQSEPSRTSPRALKPYNRHVHFEQQAQTAQEQDGSYLWPKSVLTAEDQREMRAQERAEQKRRKEIEERQRQSRIAVQRRKEADEAAKADKEARLQQEIEDSRQRLEEDSGDNSEREILADMETQVLIKDMDFDIEIYYKAYLDKKAIYQGKWCTVKKSKLVELMSDLEVYLDTKLDERAHPMAISMRVIP